MKTQTSLTLADPGAEVNRRARAYLANHRRTEYAEALKTVLRKDRKLLRAYIEAPAYQDVRALANFLNSSEEEELREELSNDLRSLSIESRSLLPALALAEKLNSFNLAVRCVPVLDNNKPAAAARFSFSLIAPDASTRARIYARLASTLRSQNFKRLRQCPTCQTFLVALDHRERFCENEKCRRRARSRAASESRRAKRERERTQTTPKNSPLERFLEFMTLQRKANPSTQELNKISPVMRALGGASAARKQIAEWEKKYPARPKAVWRELTEKQRESF